MPQLYGFDKADLAFRIGEEWGVGSDRFDNGIVMLIKPKTATSAGELFIATGYGLEGAIPDATAGESQPVRAILCPSRIRGCDKGAGKAHGRHCDALRGGRG